MSKLVTGGSGCSGSHGARWPVGVNERVMKLVNTHSRDGTV